MITTQTEIRRQFWQDNPKLSRKRIKDHSGEGTMFTTDTRCAFVDYVERLSKDGTITAELADRVTL